MKKVLIVDDDAMILTIITETIKKYRGKFEIVTAEDGLEAIKILQKQAFSLVVTDIEMPKVNGLVLLAYMAKNFPKIPFIVMTAHDSEFLKKRLQQEASRYIKKPFKVKELNDAILSVLGQPDDLKGTLKGVSVIGFLKLIEMEYITCLCEINSSEGEKGFFLFDDGTMCNAFLGDLRKEEAALKILQMEDVTIRFRKPPKGKISRRIKMELPDLFDKALKSKDKLDSPVLTRRKRIPEEKRKVSKEEKRLMAKKSFREAKKEAEVIEKQISISGEGEIKDG